MKIIQVAHGYPPYSLAGVEVYTRWLTGALRARHDVRVFSTRSDPGLEDLSLVTEELDGGPVTFLINNHVDYDPIREVRHDAIAERFAAFLDRERPDLVHFEHLIKMSATLLNVCRDRGIPTVLTLHDYWFLCPLFTLVQRDLAPCPHPGDLAGCTRCEVATAYLNREEAGTYYIAGMLEEMTEPAKWADLTGIYRDRFDPVYGPDDAIGPALITLRLGLIRRFMRDRLDDADALAAPSAFLRDVMHDHGLAGGRIRHLENGIETEGLAGCSAPPPPPPLEVLYLGTVNKHKGMHVLIEAMNRLAGRPINASLYGTGPDTRYESYLEGLIRNPAIRLGGRYDRDDLRDLLSRHHVVVMPSIWYENHPIVIREAFAAGVPVVAPDLGAIPEAIRHEIDGLLYEAGSAEALAATLVRLLEEPGLISRLRSGVPPVLNVTEHAGRYEALYAEAAKAAAARRNESVSDGPPVLLLGPGRTPAEFARALGDLLIAGTGTPRPRVYYEDAPDELAEPLADFTRRLGLDRLVQPTPDHGAPPKPALVLRLTDANPDLVDLVHENKIPCVPYPSEPAELDRRMDGATATQ